MESGADFSGVSRECGQPEAVSGAIHSQCLGTPRSTAIRFLQGKISDQYL